MKLKAIVSVTNDLFHDQRVHKVCTFLQHNGYEVCLVGRKLKNSKPLNRSYQTHRMRLFFNRNVWFYAEYSCRLFFYLLFHKADLLVSNDLDTLFPNYLISKLKGCKLVYDTHEFFTGVPELEHNAFAKKMWTRIEASVFPKLSKVYTVNDSIAGLYKELYHKDLFVVRNIPSKIDFPEIVKTRLELGLPEDKKIIILQGAGINVDRGAEEAVEAMKYIDNAILLIAGSGDVITPLKKKVQDEHLENKVWFKDKMPYSDLIQYTANCDLGLTLDKDSNINYRYSLPNKLFDYVHAGIPVLSSNLVELKKIIDHYGIGLICPSHEPEIIASFIQKTLSIPAGQWKDNLQKAANELTWEKETEHLKKIYEIK